MKPQNIVSVLGILLMLTGCASISQPRATVADRTIENASLGFSGFCFNIPAGFTLYAPAPPAEYNAMQQMAIRIYDLNNEWHPRGNEFFYEGFLLMSDETCFLLITLKSDAALPSYNSPFSDEALTSWPLMPLYNVTGRRTFEIGDRRLAAVLTSGSAYEQKGWYYAKPRRNSMLFNYEACKVTGVNRDSYILMGFALPEDANALSAPMQQMVDGMTFGGASQFRRD
jgi:hypothetical protein